MAIPKGVAFLLPYPVMLSDSETSIMPGTKWVDRSFAGLRMTRQEEWLLLPYPVMLSDSEASILPGAKCGDRSFAGLRMTVKSGKLFN